MSEVVLKAFILCEEVHARSDEPDLKNLIGAGLTRILAVSVFPMKTSFWSFIQVSDQQPLANIHLRLMRADSGRRYVFRRLRVEHEDRIRPTTICIRVFDCVFPSPGVYFVELWYNEEWLLDQRLEVN